MKNSSRIFLDHAATTPLSPSARAAMLPWIDAGNASSLYSEGRQAKGALDNARQVVSSALGCEFAELIFTSGGTEAANLAIIGAAIANTDPTRGKILLGAAEHHCVLHTAGILSRMGYVIELVRVDREGRIDLDHLRAKSGPDVLLASMMHANNELGSVNSVEEAADVVHEVGARLHVDAVQTFLKPELAGKSGTTMWSVDDLKADLVSISSHKVNGPKGAGALYVRGGVKIEPLVGGGGQERGTRGGTENVAAIVGFGASVHSHLLKPETVDVVLRDRLYSLLKGMGAVQTVLGGSRLNGHVHVRFPGVTADSLLIALDRAGISASSGAACSSGSIEPSHVLLACGYSEQESKEGLRLTLGAETTLAEVEDAGCRIAEVLKRFSAYLPGSTSA